MAESIEQKADRYLTEGKVIAVSVNSRHATFEVIGSQTYTVTGPEWLCTCPARVLECAHIVACQKITSFEKSDVSLTGDDDNSKFLQDLLSS